MSADRSNSEWTDEELVDYFRIHSRTERHLFSREMVERMIELSGVGVHIHGETRHIAVPADVADTMIEAYRVRLRRRRSYDEHPDYELPHGPETDGGGT